MPVPVRAVLFDYGMVLSGPPELSARHTMQHILSDTGEAAFDRAYWSRRDDYDRGHLTAASYWNTVANELGLVLTAEQTQQLIDADVALWTAPNNDMIAWALDLQRRGIRTGILSNIGDAMEEGILRRFDWLRGFDHHTFSHRLSLAKPDPAIYAHAIAGLGVPAREILFVDDRAENIAAAERAGMQAVQYTTHADFLHSMQARGFASLLPQNT